MRQGRKLTQKKGCPSFLRKRESSPTAGEPGFLYRRDGTRLDNPGVDPKLSELFVSSHRQELELDSFARSLLPLCRLFPVHGCELLQSALTHFCTCADLKIGSMIDHQLF